jgi:hypothetical protein
MGGAPIYVSGSELNIKDSEFSNNQGGSGAIYAYGGNTVIDNSKFIANNGTGAAGAITGAGAATSSANITVTNSVFKDLLSGSNGGAISTTGGLLVVEQSVFMNNRLNKTSNNGGAIYLAGNATINYNIFLNNSDNRPTPQGHDIYQSKSTATANVDYNYFGSNDKPVSPSVNSYITVNNWVMLDLSIDSNPSPGQEATLTADLTTYTDGETNGTVAKLLPELEFTVSAVNGTVDPTEITIGPDTQGKATITYTAPDALGEDVATIKLFDEEVASLTIEIVPEKTNTTLTSEDVEIDEGSGNLTATLTADGVGVEGKTITVVVGDEILSGVTDADGKAIIDLSSLAPGVYEDLEVVFSGDNDYTESFAIVTIIVNKVPVATELVAESVTVDEGSVV